MKLVCSKAFGLVLVCAALNAGAGAATLEKLSVDEMSRQSTLIVRGRVSACRGESQGSLIYTRCMVSVSERWKGQFSGVLSFVVPGGRADGLIQTFAGTPSFTAGKEYVLFLWAGRSSTYQVIGLSQGKFDLEATAGAGAIARRAASSERMLSRSGDPVRDEAIEISLPKLREQVAAALGEAK
ncbi:MAG TPA: hypothetical protein VES20_08870 [Bryobacteraceae bacterium]|nr:hypothetical protein [Bryobacteraceae bacterium]